MTLRVLVIDDEELPRLRVRDFVLAHTELTLVGEAADGAQALDAIVQHRPDLIFLDIQMPELDGFQVLQALDDDVMPAVVFVTAYDEFAIRAFEVGAADYMLKPITHERFDAAVRRVLGRIGSVEAVRQIRAVIARANEARGHATRFAARRGGRHYFVRVADVHWLEAEGNYMRVWTGATSHLIRDTMKNMEALLDPAHFVRIHRSFMVAIDHIRSIESSEAGEYIITMNAGPRLASSRTYSERVRRLLH